MSYEYAGDHHESMLDLIAAGDTIAMPFDGDRLEVVDVDRKHYPSGKKKVDVDVRKTSGHLVSWREHHLENAIDAGAELIAVADDGSVIRRRGDDR